MKITKQFLGRHKRLQDMATYSATVNCERALNIMLEKHLDVLPDATDGNRFHKDFRQTEVTGSWQDDMVIWHLLQSAPIFWTMLSEKD